MLKASPLSYCAQELRRHDHDRFLTCLFAPAERREALYALYAFNLEIARSAEVVSEAMIGQIRLQWWRDALEEIYNGTPRQHQVVEPLAEAIGLHGLTRAHFARLIDGREFDLDPAPPESLSALEDYAEATGASLVWLALEVLGANDGVEMGETIHQAGRSVGLAWALTGLLRAVPFHARQKRLYLPADLSAEAGLERGELFELRCTPALTQVVGEIAGRAESHLSQARILRQHVPSVARPALLLATLAEGYLRNLSRAAFDPFATAVQTAAPGRAWRLTWATLRRRYR